MTTSKWIAHLALVMIAMYLTQCSRSSGEAALSSSQRGAAPTRLEVDAEHWPVALLPLARTTIFARVARGPACKLQLRLPPAWQKKS